MLIARSTFSRASAWKGNRPRETRRSQCGEEGWYLLTAKERALVKRTRFSFVTLICRSINLSEVVKSAIHGEVTCVCSREVDRGDWGERALKEQRQVPGDPLWQGSSCLNRKVLRGTAETRNPRNIEALCIRGPQLRKDGYKTRISLNYLEETITRHRPQRKSDRSIVAKKEGNASGAKGPSFSHVSIKIRRSA